MKPILSPLFCFPVLLALTGVVPARELYCPPDALPNTKLAAKEVRRYVYLRTGEFLKISNDPVDPSGRISFLLDPALSPQQYRLKTTGTNLTISGGPDVAVLYGAYAFAEKLGVRFYLHGDVSHLGRGVWQAALPPADADYEYHVTAGNDLVWPATAPQTSQTIVIVD